VIGRTERDPMERMEVLYVAAELSGFPPLEVVTAPPAVFVACSFAVPRFPTVETSSLVGEDVLVQKGRRFLRVDKKLGPPH
jgi:hypothetical protein